MSKGTNIYLRWFSKLVVGRHKSKVEEFGQKECETRKSGDTGMTPSGLTPPPGNRCETTGFCCESHLAVTVVPLGDICKTSWLWKCVRLAIGAVSPGGVSSDGISEALGA